jgi:predicted PurR-regulated permease PerM
MKNPDRLELSHYFLFLLLGLSVYLCFSMVRHYLDPILLAVILALLTRPIQAFLTLKFKGRRTLATLCTCLLLTLTILLPLALISLAVIREGIQSFNAISRWVTEGNLETLWNLPWVSRLTTHVKPYLSMAPLKDIDIQALLISTSSKAGQLLVNQGGNIIGNLSVIVAQFFLMIFIYFFILLDFDEISAAVSHLMPLSAEHERVLGNKVKTVARSALLGSLATSAAQGLAGGIAFAVCGLPGFFWGTVMAFASLIPMVGTALVWLPAAAYLALAGSYKLSLFMVLWSILVVGSIDNLLRPLFMKGAAEMNTLLVFLAILGGINTFGLPGLIYGPLIFGLTMVLIYIYELEFSVFLNNQDRR